MHCNQVTFVEVTTWLAGHYGYCAKNGYLNHLAHMILCVLRIMQKIWLSYEEIYSLNYVVIFT